MKLSLEESTEICRVLADPSRVRLLLILAEHSLSVGELTDITGLSQSRISTHLSKLRAMTLVTAERVSGATRFSVEAPRHDAPATLLWNEMRARMAPESAAADIERAEQVIRQRGGKDRWADSVAGRMERFYSPGRSWEATARALLPLLSPGKVLDVASGDGVLAELMATRSESVTCVDYSEKVISAARQRLKKNANVKFLHADMHQLPLDDNQFDVVFLLHALAYSTNMQQVIAECARVTRGGGQIIIAALKKHEHEIATREFDHVNLGVSEKQLSQLLGAAKLNVEFCAVTSRETRLPNFEVITAVAVKV